MDQGRHKEMVKTISTTSKEHINAIQTDLTKTKEKENMLKEINHDESHSLKQKHLYYSNLVLQETQSLQ